MLVTWLLIFITRSHHLLETGPHACLPPNSSWLCRYPQDCCYNPVWLVWVCVNASRPKEYCTDISWTKFSVLFPPPTSTLMTYLSPVPPQKNTSKTYRLFSNVHTWHCHQPQYVPLWCQWIWIFSVIILTNKVSLLYQRKFKPFVTSSNPSFSDSYVSLLNWWILSSFSPSLYWYDVTPTCSPHLLQDKVSDTRLEWRCSSCLQCHKEGPG